MNYDALKLYDKLCLYYGGPSLKPGIFIILLIIIIRSYNKIQVCRIICKQYNIFNPTRVLRSSIITL